VLKDDFDKLLQDFCITYWKKLYESTEESTNELKINRDITLEKLNTNGTELLRKMFAGQLTEHEKVILKEFQEEASEYFDGKNTVNIWILIKRKNGKKRLQFKTFVGMGTEAIEKAHDWLDGKTEKRTGGDGATYVKSLDTKDVVYVRPLYEIIVPF